MPLGKIRLRRAALATVLGAFGGVSGLAMAVIPAQAAAHTASLTATPNDLTSSPSGPLDVTTAPTANVSVTLDPGCFNVFNKGQTYTIGAVSSDTTVATVSPSGSGPLNCGDSALFTVTAHCSSGTAPWSATITFTPVAGPAGQQKKLGNAQVPVTVTDTAVSCLSITPTPPPTSGANPAAPAVANLYLDNNPLVPNTTNNTVAGFCKTTLSGAKNWRGQVVSAVAHWMPRPESLKDTAFTDPNDWLLYVESEVNTLCSVPGGVLLSTSIPSVLVPYSTGPLGA